MTTKVTQRRRYRLSQFGLALLSGLLYWAAFPNKNQWYLAYVAFVPVVWAAREETPWRALKLGAIMGLVSHAIAYFWINHLLIEFAQAPWPLAALGWLALCLQQGASYGVGVALARWLTLRTGWPWMVTLAVGLTAMDFTYPLIFPSYIANTQFAYYPLRQLADLFGVLGLTALIGMVNGALVDFLAARKAGAAHSWRPVAIAGFSLFAGYMYGSLRKDAILHRMEAAPKLNVGLIQTNIGGMERLEEMPLTIEKYRRMTADLVEKNKVDLVVWPEGAYGSVVTPQTNVRREVLNGIRVPLLFGGIRLARDEEGDSLPYNSAFLADEHGKVLGSYDKHVLIAFGE